VSRRTGLPAEPGSERPIITHVYPAPPDVGLALCQNRYGGVVAVQALPSQHVRLDALVDRLQHGRTGANLISQGRQAQRHAFPGIALGLAVQWLMLAELLEQNHRQETRSRPASRDHVEGCRRLADRLAVAAGELLADMLDHLPLAGDHLQRLGDVLPQLGQACTAATGAGCWP